MDFESIRHGIHEILVKGFEIDENLISPNAKLADDLGLDSLDGVDLVVAIEKKFGCRIAESEARAMRSLQDIYDAIGRHLGAVA